MLETPITGGNVSFYNETLGKAIYPTPVLGVLGLMEDAECALGAGFRNEGDLILVLDGLGDGAATKSDFASSEYAKTIHGAVAGTHGRAEENLQFPDNRRREPGQMVPRDAVSAGRDMAAIRTGATGGGVDSLEPRAATAIAMAATPATEPAMMPKRFLDERNCDADTSSSLSSISETTGRRL